MASPSDRRYTLRRRIWRCRAKPAAPLPCAAADPAPCTSGGSLTTFDYTGSGFESCTIPVTGTYTIYIRGADGRAAFGGAGGTGASLLTFDNLQKNDVLSFYIGGAGAPGQSEGPFVPDLPSGGGYHGWAGYNGLGVEGSGGVTGGGNGKGGNNTVGVDPGIFRQMTWRYCSPNPEQSRPAFMLGISCVAYPQSF